MVWLQNRPWIEDEENPYYAGDGDEHEEADELEDEDEDDFEDEDFDEDDEFEDDEFEDEELEDEDLEEESNEEGEEPGPATPLMTGGSTPQSQTAA
ncbi:MAG: hypothetical protein ACE5JD_08065 [Candidatus Methylomirabilia bacterium]